MARMDALEAAKWAPQDGEIQRLLKQVEQLDRMYEEKSRKDMAGILRGGF